MEVSGSVAGILPPQSLDNPPTEILFLETVLDSASSPTPDRDHHSEQVPGQDLSQSTGQSCVQAGPALEVSLPMVVSSSPVQDASLISANNHPQQSPSRKAVQCEPQVIPACTSQELDICGRSSGDIMRDYLEVNRVVHGGKGSSDTEPLSWPTQSEPTTLGEDTSSQAQLPFSHTEIPCSFLVPAKPVVKTNSLKEIRISFNNNTFTDRLLPQAALPMSTHPRFTPSYYVALHNLAAGPGHDGNGFYYSENTPNYLGARIPLAHTGLDLVNWRRHLVGYADSELLQFLEFGFPLGMVSPELSPCTRNHGSSYQYFPYLDKFVTSEITRSGLTGPFKSPPWPDLMLSPMMTAPKKPNSRRPVFDASFGDNSLNNSTPGEHYLGTPTLYTYPKIDDFRRIVLSCGRGSFLWKKDLHRFFMQIPLDPVEYRHVGFVWRCLFFFFVGLMFGLRHSGLQGQRMTDAVSWIHRSQGLDTFSEVPYNCINYSDDLGGAERDRERAEESFRRLGKLLSELGLVESADKARAPSTTMVYLGVQFDTNDMTMSVPPEKMAEIKTEIESWCRKTTTVKRSLQSLLGKLFWVSRVVRHSRTFMGRLLAQLREMSAKPDNQKVKLSEECRKDLLWWRYFLKEYNGISLIENEDPVRLSLDQLLDCPFTVCAGDATPVGGGAWHGSSYWSRQLPLPLQDPTLPVHVKEFLVVLVSIKIWGSNWSGMVVQIFCDNDAVCHVIDGERPTDPRMLSLLREFKFYVCKFRFYPTIRTISTTDNVIADHISRRHDDQAAQAVFASHGLGHMSLIKVPDRHFDLTATW